MNEPIKKIKYSLRKDKQFALTERDVEILILLYENRSLTNPILMNVFDVSLQVVSRRMNKLYKQGCIQKEHIEGYSLREGHVRKGVSYRLTNKGISMLIEITSLLEKRAYLELERKQIDVVGGEQIELFDDTSETVTERLRSVDVERGATQHYGELAGDGAMIVEDMRGNTENKSEFDYAEGHLMTKDVLRGGKQSSETVTERLRSVDVERMRTSEDGVEKKEAEVTGNTHYEYSETLVVSLLESEIVSSFMERKRNERLKWQNADALRVSKMLLPVVLTTTEVTYELKLNKWQYHDSRKTKQMLNLDRATMIQGLLYPPYNKSEREGLYVINGVISDKFYSRLKAEIIRHTMIRKYIVLTNGKTAFENFMTRISEGDNLVSRVKNIKVLPVGYAKNYLKVFHSDEQIKQYLLDVYENVFTFKELEKNNRTSFESIINYEGEDFYFVNLLDNDLAKIRHLKQYHKDKFEVDKRKVMILTNDHFNKMHKEMLKDYHHMYYLNESVESLMEYIAGKIN
ncbi:winged helix-turn-helix domain-containing protein [Lysinibacillus sp. 1P01SD]|uniref:winged helix-turn-helix domain-containing protein n=1 Tax=Lysinibacillus sp. 1P01SD TaxID=3132285 RepID=UPI0039A3CA2A